MARRGPRTPESQRAAGPGLLEAALGSRGAGRRRADSAGRPREGAGRRGIPEAGSPPSLRPPSPPISCLPFSFRPPCPEERRAPPLPLGRAARAPPGPPSHRGAGGGFRRGGCPGGRGARSRRRWGLARFPHWRPPSPKRKKLASPHCGAGRASWCQKGCVFAALRWPLRYTFASSDGTSSINTGCAPGRLERSLPLWGGACRVFLKGEPEKGGQAGCTRASGYNKPEKGLQAAGRTRGWGSRAVPEGTRGLGWGWGG